MRDPSLTVVLEGAVANGLIGAALVERGGKTIAIAGALSEDQAMPLAALAMYRHKSDDLSARLFAGEILELELEDRVVALAVAKKQLFIVAILGPAMVSSLGVFRELTETVQRMLADVDLGGFPPATGGDGGSGSGPAELSLVEWGIAVTRPRAKA